MQNHTHNMTLIVQKKKIKGKTGAVTGGGQREGGRSNLHRQVCMFPIAIVKDGYFLLFKCFTTYLSLYKQMKVVHHYGYVSRPL